MFMGWTDPQFQDKFLRVKKNKQIADSHISWLRIQKYSLYEREKKSNISLNEFSS